MRSLLAIALLASIVLVPSTSVVGAIILTIITTV